MAALATGQISIVDLADGKSLSCYINSNQPRIQVQEVNAGTFSPDWSIAAGNVKLSASKKAFTGTAIAGGKQVSTDLRIKLDGINLVTRQNMLLTAELATVSAQDAFDFLGGKLASVPLKGKLRIAAGQTAPFILKYL